MPRLATACISSISTTTARSPAGSPTIGAAPGNLTVSVPDPQILTEHLQEAARHYAPDVILIDIAGSYEQALTIAIARAHLTIIPACTTEADIFEAARVARHIQTVFAAFGRIPLYRVLATRVAPLVHARPGPWLQGDRAPEAAHCCARSLPTAPPMRRSASPAYRRILAMPSALPRPKPLPSSTSSRPRSMPCSPRAISKGPFLQPRPPHEQPPFFPPDRRPPRCR